jgi:hypothetical protein
MRVNVMCRIRRGSRISPWQLSRWAFGAVALLGVIPDAMAGDSLHGMSGAWASAAALSLTLLTAMRESQR